MRWSTCVKGAGLLLAGLAGVVPAQGPGPAGAVPPQYVPYVAPSLPYYQGYGYPGCPVPGMPPYGMVPPAMLPPGVAAPAPTRPGTTAPTPGTTPSTPGTPRPSAEQPGGVTNADGRAGDQSALQQAAAAAQAADGRSEIGAGGGGERGSGGVASLAPNMFGDIFGGGRIRTTVPADRLAMAATFRNDFTTTPPTREVFTLSDGRLLGVSPRSFEVFAGARSVNDFIIPIRIAAQQAAATGSFVALNTVTPQFGINSIGPLPGPPGGSEFRSAVPVVNPQLFRVFPIDSPAQVRLNELSQLFFDRTGKAGTPVFLPADSGVLASRLNANLQEYQVLALVDYLVTSEVPSPSSGGIVGRQKISDDNSPFPRDRIIFNYDYFSATPLGFNGADVHRFSPGIEMTFFDQWASGEIRFPFAGTLSSNLIADAFTPRQTVFGNITTAVKWLFFRSSCLNFSAGSSFAFPTAPDQYIKLSDGTPLVKFSNDSVVITPFVAGFFNTDRFVFQAWWAVAFDTLGSGVSANLDFTGLQKVTRYREPALSQLDGQLSYWFYQSSGAWSWLTGVAWFTELHNNVNLTRPKALTIGNFSFSDGTKFNDLNLAAGLIFNISDAASLTVGVTTPLRQDPNRGFDYQIGIRGNIFFGPTLRDRTGALYSTF
jgi:hypothetical protein